MRTHNCRVRAAMAGGAGNPTIRLLESKVELLRTSLAAVARTLADDFKAERRARAAADAGSA